MIKEFGRSDIIEEKGVYYLQVTQYNFNDKHSEIISIEHFTLKGNSREEVRNQYYELS